MFTARLPKWPDEADTAEDAPTDEPKAASADAPAAPRIPSFEELAEVLPNLRRDLR